jgi:hypothetical protein
VLSCCRPVAVSKKKQRFWGRVPQSITPHDVHTHHKECYVAVRPQCRPSQWCSVCYSSRTLSGSVLLPSEAKRRCLFFTTLTTTREGDSRFEVLVGERTGSDAREPNAQSSVSVSWDGIDPILVVCFVCRSKGRIWIRGCSSPPPLWFVWVSLLGFGYSAIRTKFPVLRFFIIIIYGI